MPLSEERKKNSFIPGLMLCIIKTRIANTKYVRRNTQRVFFVNVCNGQTPLKCNRTRRDAVNGDASGIPKRKEVS